MSEATGRLPQRSEGEQRTQDLRDSIAFRATGSLELHHIQDFVLKCENRLACLSIEKPCAVFKELKRSHLRELVWCHRQHKVHRVLPRHTSHYNEHSGCFEALGASEWYSRSSVMDARLPARTKHRPEKIAAMRSLSSPGFGSCSTSQSL